MRAHPTHARPVTGAAARALWLVRWVLVLLLIWDQAGLPLHQHHHDFGIDGQWIGASLHIGHSGRAHADAGQDDPRISHAVLAVRPQFDLGAAIFGPDSCDSVLPSAATVVGLADRVALEVASPRLGEPRPTYRSLPPAGRAPPLHT